ncbi:hypothetical protein [Pseudoduganella violaceinigra]|uniref:hypothetical protein n=1 Tax=Pseudoduganella violaceinigra TaxID=246602 RepID=UPI0012B5EDAC|nr:hypothetical protein [Pseudoduganella violaceinigra]
MTIALLTVFLVVWSSLAYFSEPVSKEERHGPEAKAFVTQSIQDFCSGLYSDGVCPKTAITETQKWTATSFLGMSGITTRETDAILSSQGWEKLASENEKLAIFCKQGYSARYDHAAGQVGTIFFMAGSHICEKLALKNRA